jgi:hopanoid biosynthesis associated protein HpnK
VKQLIVTADDFGAAHEVNMAVEQAHLHGVLTAASLMVGAPAAAEAVTLAKRLPSLRVGLHLVLADGVPILPASQVGDLVDASGRFRTGMVAAGAAMFFRPRARAQLAAEITGQFEAFAATGLVLDHVNAHKHFHLHPTIAGLIIETGRRFGLRAVRVPNEPESVLSAIEPISASPLSLVMDPWSGRLRRRLKAAGLVVPDQVFGLRWSGAMTGHRLLGLLRQLPHGLTEIYLHPATGTYAGSAQGYRYADELAALLAPEVAHAAHGPDIKVGGFADFPTARLPLQSAGTSPH